MTTQQHQMNTGKGIVKQVNSGDIIVIRGTPKGGPPEEITIGLSGVRAPRLARRSAPDSKDEPCAYAAREYLRNRLIGKKVFFTYDKPRETAEKTKTAIHSGIVYDGEDANAENITEKLVSMGLVDVRGSKQNEYIKKLEELQETAKASGKGKYSSDASKDIREIVWDIEDLQRFKDEHDNIGISAIVEQVLDGSTIRVQLLDDKLKKSFFTRIMLTGIKTPGFPSEQPPEPYAQEAKYFTECRLLQRNVIVYLENVSSKMFLGTILHPNGNIAEHLLKEGFAKCLNWSMKFAIHGKANLREAEMVAKNSRLRVWKDYVPKVNDLEEFEACVVEVINADALLVQRTDESVQKIFLSSIKPPRPISTIENKKKTNRALYDVPHMFEAREFLRKKLIGSFVNVTVDYIQAANAGFPEKTCCTVRLGVFNVAEALVSKGLATVVRYRTDDDQRSSCYDDLLVAEARAMKAKKNIHGEIHEMLRIVDVTVDLKTAKQYLTLLKRAGKIDAVVEFVSSGSRFRLFLPKQNYLMTFLLAGISCPRPTRDMPNGKVPGDLYGDDALKYMRSMLMQRDVVIEVDSLDKGGNFLGYVFDSNNRNCATSLVREGFADVHHSATFSAYYQELKTALNHAQATKLKMWKEYESITSEQKDDSKERIVNYLKVSVTAIKEDLSDLMFYAQHFDEGPKLEELMKELREEFESNPPLPGAYTPKKGDLCAAMYSCDGLWYRAKIGKIIGNETLVTFIDFGNKEQVSMTHLASLPAKYQSPSPWAHEYALAFVKLPKDPDSAFDAQNAFSDAITDSSLLLNREYQNSAISYVTLAKLDSKEDIGKELVEKGYVFIEKKKERKLQKVMNEYGAAQDIARKKRLNLWMYGDITEDDAKEFG